jgi:hypothetical protein
MGIRANAALALIAASCGCSDARPRPQPATFVKVPPRAGEAIEVADSRSRVAVRFSPAGAVPPAADVSRRVSSAGIEDFVSFRKSPAAEELRYEVDVRAVAGLRLVERTLEFLDAGGAPRLRVEPPSLVDARGRTIAAALTLEGCRVDRNPAAPWGRPTIAPGRDACTIVVSWAGRGARYPLVVDPAWVGTGAMTSARSFAAVALLPNPVAPPGEAAQVLVAGGFDAGGAVLATAEIYEPLSRTFAATGAMVKARAAHTATVVPGASGLVLIAGGAGTLTDPTPPEKLSIVSLGDAMSTELYSPATGKFTLAASMSVPRFFHTATALADGAIALVGGTTDLVNQPTKQADLFTWTAAQPSGTITPTAGPMSSARAGHAAALLANGDLLITGGIGNASFALLSGEILCHNAGCGASLDHFSTVTTSMSAPRAFHTATSLPNGDVLLAGGVNATSAPITYSSTADRFTAGAFAAAIALMHPRAFHAAVALSPAPLFGGAATQIALVGGFDGVADLPLVEGYQSSAGAMAALPALAAGRRRATAIVVNAGESIGAGRAVLVAGGISGSTTTGGTFTNGAATTSAELLVRALGEACAAGGECLSGFCANGLCCDRACTADCEACAAAGKESGAGDGTCGPAKNGTPLATMCVADVEIHNVCDGAGHATAGAGTHACPSGCSGSTCAPVDLSPPADLATPADLAAPDDLAVPDDLAAPVADLAAPKAQAAGCAVAPGVPVACEPLFALALFAAALAALRRRGPRPDRREPARSERSRRARPRA